MPDPLWVNLAQQLSFLGEARLMLIGLILATVLYVSAWLRSWRG
jgi:hypothetical protein